MSIRDTAPTGGALIQGAGKVTGCIPIPQPTFGTPWRDRTVHLAMSPLQLVQRLGGQEAA
jgi:hypothetical protein